MKVRVTGSDNHKWYKDKIGEVFEVYKQAHECGLHVVVPRAVEGWGILPEHFEAVIENKIVEHDGVKYEVPEWAKYLTRDDTASGVFAWENEPVWSDAEGYQDDKLDGKRVWVHPYVAPKPEGNFFKEI